MQSDQSRQNSLVITASVLVGLSVLVVATRLVIRLGVIRNAGWDDYTIGVALIFAIGYLAEILVGAANRMGFPMADLTMENKVIFFKATLAIEVTYYSAVAFVKLSLLCMFLRFIISRRLRMICYVTIGVHIVFYIVCVSVTLGQCRPFNKFWDATFTAPGSCINGTAFFYFTSSFNIVTDFWILGLPIKTLNGISRPRNEKLTLIAIFGVGLFATITSIIRLRTIYTYTLSTDPFRDSITINLWSIIEINVGIMCASVPALKPLFTPSKLRQVTRGTKQSAGYRFHSSERSGVEQRTKSDEQLCAPYELSETSRSAAAKSSSEVEYPPTRVGPSR